jgi:uncharacterized protein with PIN domain
MTFGEAGCERCRTYWLGGREDAVLHQIPTKKFGLELYRCEACGQFWENNPWGYPRAVSEVDATTRVVQDSADQA